MSDMRAFNRYAVAREDFERDPSLRNEGAVVAAYAEFARAYCPEHAAELITLLCRQIAELAGKEAA